MAIRAVGLLSPGDMGHSVGAVIRWHGLPVLTCLERRSARTRALAAEAGIDDAPSVEELVQRVDIVLCILPPAAALATAERVAAALRATGARPLYVDCNAIAPGTMRAIAETILAAGGRVADAG